MSTKNQDFRKKNKQMTHLIDIFLFQLQNLNNIKPEKVKKKMFAKIVFNL